MKRRRQRLQVSTFPFLAVLLSAMGSLILVLLAVDQKARAAARAKAQREAALVVEKAEQAAAERRAEAERNRQEARASWERQREDLHNRLSAEERELQARMKRLRDQLADAASRLRAEADETGQLRRRLEVQRGLLEGAEKRFAQARATNADAASQSEAARALLARMTRDVEQLERVLADLKAARARDRQTYSVVPYRGRHGESRRPLYVECAGGQLVFHPDRLVLPESSPAVDVRTEVERRFARQKEQMPPSDPAADHPYLMVLVRPDGVTSYYHLQASLGGLHADFGYEFIDADWLLDFPTEDSPAKSQPWPAAANTADTASPVGGTPTGTPLKGVPAAQGTGPPPTGHPAGTRTGGQPAAEGSGWFPPGGDPLAVPGDHIAGTSQKPSHGTAEILPPSVTTAEGGSGGTGSGQGPASGGPKHSPPAALHTESAGGGSPPPGMLPSVALAGRETAPLPAPANPATASSVAKGPSANGPPPSPDAPAASGSDRPPGVGLRSVFAPPGGTPTNAPAAPATEKPTAPQPPADKPSSTDKPSSSAQQGSPGPPERAGDVAGRLAPRVPGTPERRPSPMRPVNLSGDRDWVIYVECTAEGVILYPAQLFIPLAVLNRGPANPLQQNVQQMIDRRQAAVRPGEAPYRPQVRFLVRPESLRVYHVAYPALDAVRVPKTRYNLQPEDDVPAIVTGK
jgi:hypothetical protein